MSTDNVIGEKIKTLRKQKKMTLQQLARESDISAGYISKMERGTVNPTIKNIQRLCFALGITANELMVDQSKIENRTSSGGQSYVLRKQDRVAIYGVTNALHFESVFEDNPHFKLNVLTLASNMQEQSYSIHGHDEFGIIAKGKLHLTLDDDEKYELNEGDCIMIRANTKHSMTNSFTEECISFWIEICSS